MNKVFIRFFLIFALFFTFVSCKNLIINPVEKKTETDVAYLCMNDTSVSARTVNPDIKTSDFKYFELLGKCGNEEKRLLGTWNSINTFSLSKVNVSLGVWDFYLTAKVDESSQTVFKAEILNKNIVSGANYLSFSLVPYTYSMGDKGEFQITVRIPCDKVTHAIACLKATDFISNDNISDIEDERLSVVSASDTGDSKDRIEFFGQNVDSGIYNAVITLYKDDVELNTITSIVNIVDGFVSAGTIDLDDIENIYTIEFELNGGTWINPLIIPSVYSRNSEIYLPEEDNITLDGYTFAGWYSQLVSNETALTVGTTPSGQRVTVINAGNTGNKKFYAYFTLNTYSIVYDANGGSGIMGIQSFRYTTSQTLNTNRFNKTGYHLQGWNTNSDGTGTNYAAGQTITMPLDGLVLYAIWEPNTYTVLFNPNGGSGSMGNQIMTYDLAATLNANSFTRNGYRFKCWSLEPDGSGLCYSDSISVKNLTANNNVNVALYAQWDYWLSEGDIVLKDGSIRSNSTNLSNAAAVIFRGTTEKSPALGFAVLTSENANKTYAWAAKNTTGANKKFTTVSDGSANWSVISTADEEGSVDAQVYYPAFYAAQHLAENQDMGIYTYGWYLPSKDEAGELLEKYYDESYFPDTFYFWTSSADSSAYAWLGYREDNDGSWDYDVISCKRTDTPAVLPIRAFGKEYIINYILDGGFCPEGTPLKHTYGVETSLTIPVRYGFMFEGWYSDSGFTNRVYSVSAESTNVTLYAKWKASYSVGDIILKDGTVILYNKIDSMTSEQKKNAVAVIFKANDDDDFAFGVGLKPKTFKWSSNTSYSFVTSETDGRTNWGSIRQTDTAGAETSASNYPAMDYAVNYTDYCDTGLYKNDWYLPSKKELEEIVDLYSYGDGSGPFFNSLRKLEIYWEDYEFWSSSQELNNANSIWTYDIWYESEDDSLSVVESDSHKTSYCYSLPVRPFGVGHKINYVLNGGTLAVGSPAEHLYGSETKLKDPVYYGYSFIGWYSDSSFSGERKCYVDPEEKDVTLYAKWEKLDKFNFSTLSINEFEDYLINNLDNSSNNVLRISGKLDKSDMKQFSDLIKSYSGYIGVLDMSELDVEEFFNSGNGSSTRGVFTKLKALKEVILPKTLVTINEGAFAYCGQLEKVTMYEGVTKILWSAFCGCNKLKTIKISDSVVLIDQTAFFQCSDLEEVQLSENSQLHTIGLAAFKYCSSLNFFYLPKKVTSLNNMGTDCTTTYRNLTFSSSTLGSFYGCTSLKSIIFESTLKNINGYTFEYCPALTDVYYTGTETEWNTIKIGTGNGSITSATKHYNYVN